MDVCLILTCFVLHNREPQCLSVDNNTSHVLKMFHSYPNLLLNFTQNHLGPRNNPRHPHQLPWCPALLLWCPLQSFNTIFFFFQYRSVPFQRKISVPPLRTKFKAWHLKYQVLIYFLPLLASIHEFTHPVKVTSAPSSLGQELHPASILWPQRAAAHESQSSSRPLHSMSIYTH